MSAHIVDMIFFILYGGFSGKKTFKIYYIYSKSLRRHYFMSFRVEEPLEFNRTVPLDHVLPKLQTMVSAACNLYNCAMRIYFGRIARATTEWRTAADLIVDPLCMICDFFAAVRDKDHQIRFLMRNVHGWVAACERKTWRTFCGRSHSIPTDKIDAFRDEARKLQLMVDEANKNQNK